MGSGRDFTAAFLDVTDGDVVFRKDEADQLYRTFLAELGAPGLAGLSVPVVSTFGLAAHFFATKQNWHIYRAGDDWLPGFLTSRLLDGIIRAMARDALAFYRYAKVLELRVLAVLPPQRVPDMADPEVFQAAQEVLRRALLDLGVEIVDLRARVTGETGTQRPELCERDDPIHGNLAFGRLILADLLDRGL